MDPDISDHLLERYCAGDCTLAERAEVEAWLAADRSRAQQLALLAAGWREAGSAGAPPERPDVRQAWARVQARVRDTHVTPSIGDVVLGGDPHSGARTDNGGSAQSAAIPAVDSRSGTWRWLRGSGIAAAAAALVLAAGGALLLTQGTRRSAPPEIADGAMREIVTRRGQHAALDLPDGSRMVVAAESRVKIPRSYRPEVGARDVYLEEGQVYFEVEHDEARPFRVHAANGIAEDLGTEFVVTAYPETRGLEIVVAQGAVALHAMDAGSRHQADPRALLTLAPGELGRLDATGTATLTRGVSLPQYVGWVTGKLVFDSTRVGDVVARLARWYDVDIRLADPRLAERRVTVALQGQTADQALEHIALSLGVVIERQDGLVVLREY